LIRLLTPLGRQVVEESEKGQSFEMWTESMYEELDLPKWDDTAWAAWEDLLSRPYFSRLWVVSC
jgi:hypothetical protein